jgi:hypothetical protein
LAAPSNIGRRGRTVIRRRRALSATIRAVSYSSTKSLRTDSVENTSSPPSRHPAAKALIAG